MHVRYSTVLGLPVVDEEMTDRLGIISGIFIHPDTGKVEGFFVRISGFLHSEHLFLSSIDILRWGLRVVVRDADVFSPIEERVRLQSLFEEKRYILGQPIVTDTGRKLGVCADVQFDTTHFMVDWLWPKRLWKWGTALPLSQVLEVRRDAVIVRDPRMAVSEKLETTSILNRLPDVA